MQIDSNFFHILGIILSQQLNPIRRSLTLSQFLNGTRNGLMISYPKQYGIRIFTILFSCELFMEHIAQGSSESHNAFLLLWRWASNTDLRNDFLSHFIIVLCGILIYWCPCSISHLCHRIVDLFQDTDNFIAAYFGAIVCLIYQREAYDGLNLIKLMRNVLWLLPGQRFQIHRVQTWSFNIITNLWVIPYMSTTGSCYNQWCQSECNLKNCMTGLIWWLRCDDVL